MINEPKNPGDLAPEEKAQRKAALEEMVQQREALEKEADDIINTVESDPTKYIHPATYALTAEESQAVARAKAIYFKTLRRFASLPEEELKAAQEKIREATVNALESEAIDIKQLRAIYARTIEQGLYWSVFLSGLTIGDKSKGEPNADVYMIGGNYEPIWGKEIEVPAGAPQTFLDDQIKKLNIPDNVAYVSDDDLYFLWYIPSLFKDASDTPAPKQKPPARPTLPNIPTYGMMNDNVNNTIRQGLPWPADGQLNLFTMPNGLKMLPLPKVYQGKKGDKKRGRPKSADAVFTKVAFLYVGENTENTKLSKVISAYDQAVLEAVSTAFHHWNYAHPGEPLKITPQEIWRIMNGTQDTSRNPSPKQLRQVCDSMDKMRFTQIYMDVSEEIQEMGLAIDDDRIKKGIIDDYLLNASRAEITTEKGRVIEAYRINMPPILYVYNFAKNHLLYYDLGLLDTSDTTGNEGYTIEIRNYLIQQIQLMGHGERDNHRILYSTLYEATGIPTPEERISRDNTRKEKAGTKKTDNTYQSNVRKEAKKDREKINALLDSFKKKGHIKGYTIAKKGSTYIGVDIQLPPRKR